MNGEEGTNTTTNNTPICGTCGMPYWTIGTGAQTCRCNSQWTTNWTPVEPSNQSILDQITILQDQYDKIWRKLNAVMRKMKKDGKR